MHASETRPVGKPFFQLGIKSALLLLLMIGVCLGWWSDRARLVQELAKSEIEREIQDRQIEIFRQIPVRGRGTYKSYFENPFTTPEAFIGGVRNGPNSLCPMSDARGAYDETLVMLLSLLSEPDPKVRRNACMVLQEQYRAEVRWRIEKHNPNVDKHLIDMLELSDPDGPDTRAAIELLGIIGQDAEQAIAELLPIMRNDGHPQAVFATVAVSQIHPQTDPVARLIEVVHADNSEWEEAVINLLDHLSQDEVKDLLVEFYATRQKEADRDAVVDLINRLKL